MALTPPTEISDRRYRLHEVIGVGSAATVYRCTDNKFALDRAVKLLPPGLGALFESYERFRREVMSMAKLHHPHVVDVFDVGVEAGWMYIVAEILHGGTLDKRIAAEGPLDQAVATRLMEETLRALQAAHEHGVVHRDVRPNNVLLDKHGHAKLGDFGLARLSAEDTALTGPGRAMGRRPWAAPEQLVDARSADGRADVYAAGMTFAAMLLGRVPEHRDAAVDALEGPVKRIVATATEAEPGDRYQSAAAMREALLEP